MKTMIKFNIIGLLGGLIFILGSFDDAFAGRRDKLTLYCSAEVEWCQAMTNAFEKDTGIKVSMTRKSTGETLAQVKAERKRPKADIWWGGTGDPHLQAAEEGLLTEYKSSKLDQLKDWAQRQAKDSGYKTVGIYAGALGIVYNEELFIRHKLKPIKCWNDLLRPELKGKVQMANPNSSGTAYTLLSTIVQLFDQEKGFSYMKKLHANINQYTKSGSAPLKSAARGETTVAIGFMHDAVKLIKKGFPIKMVAPCEGTGYEIGSMSVIKGAPHMENAKKWVEWALSPEAQSIATKIKAYQMPSNKLSQVPKEAEMFKTLKLIEYDFKKYGSSTVRKNLLDIWNKEVKTL